MRFLSEANFDWQGKKVIVRLDTDVDLVKKRGRWWVDEDFRLRSGLPTLRFLKEKGVEKIILLGHLGRPRGKKREDLSLKPVADWFSDRFFSCSLFSLEETPPEGFLVMAENLRFWPGEEGNDSEFVDQLKRLGDVFVNDAFGVCHRPHASIIGLPSCLPSFLGIRVEGEMKTLSWLKRKAPRPLVFILGGSKEGKLDYLKFLSEWADFLLVGGKLPFLLEKRKIGFKKRKVKIGELDRSGKDISKETIEEFVRVIKKGKTIVWAGPMGVYEEKEYQRGTVMVARAVSQEGEVRIAGGGDTHRVLSWSNLWEKFDFVSVGGGAMLQFLRDETLPGIAAIG